MFSESRALSSISYEQVLTEAQSLGALRSNKKTVTSKSGFQWAMVARPILPVFPALRTLRQEGHKSGATESQSQKVSKAAMWRRKKDPEVI